jgi:hypothetical protein
VDGGGTAATYGTSEKVSADGGMRNAVAQRTHRRGSVDGGVDGFGHDGDGFGPGDGVGSDSGGQDGMAKRRVRTAVRDGETAVRSDNGCPNGAVGAAFKLPGAFGHCRPQQPIRERRGATLPLTAGPHVSVVF